jgi:hypothetical protein
LAAIAASMSARRASTPLTMSSKKSRSASRYCASSMSRAEPVVVKFLQQPRERRVFHLLLVERLDGCKAGGGAGSGAGSRGHVRAL